MRITKQLPQFKDETVLLVVMGTHHGVIYAGRDGTISQVAEVRVDIPEYSDNEGLFMRGGGGKTYSIGSVLEPKKNATIAKFSKEMVQKVKESLKSNDAKILFLFASPRMKRFIEHDWTNEMHARIRRRFDGNYVSHTPLELIRMIAEDEQNGRTHRGATGEAKKLLDKTDDIH